MTCVHGPNTDSWQQDFTLAAAALGEPAKGKQVLADVEARMAAQRPLSRS